MSTPHPATYNDGVLAEMQDMLPPEGLVLDPMAGVGKIGLVAQFRSVAVDLEAEWVSQAARRSAKPVKADSTALPFSDASFAAVACSPAYGSRMADQYVPKVAPRRSDGTRMSYRLKLGRPLTANSGAAMQWGPAYRDLHRAAAVEWLRVLRPGGTLLLNMKDHLRAWILQPVTAWWWQMLADEGFRGPLEVRAVLAGGDQNTSRARAKGLGTINYETVARFERPQEG